MANQVVLDNRHIRAYAIHGQMQCPAAVISSASSSSGVNKPETTEPKATTQAPVNVAISITNAGLKRLI